jgi:hypothetical protein
MTIGHLITIGINVRSSTSTLACANFVAIVWTLVDAIGSSIIVASAYAWIEFIRIFRTRVQSIDATIGIIIAASVFRTAFGGHRCVVVQWEGIVVDTRAFIVAV